MKTFARLKRSISEAIIKLPSGMQIPRSQMPQIRSIYLDEFIKFLQAHGVTTTKEVMPPTHLKPTQGDLNTDRVDAMPKDLTVEKPIRVTADGYIVDGHHRWVQTIAHGQKLVHVVKFHCDIHKLLALAKEFPKTEYAGIHVTNAERSQFAAHA